MQARNLIATTLSAFALIASAGAFAQSTDATPYRYGQELDIAKVISIDVPSSPQCEVVTATMTYRTSAGDIQAITYNQLNTSCANQN